MSKIIDWSLVPEKKSIQATIDAIVEQLQQQGCIVEETETDAEEAFARLYGKKGMTSAEWFLEEEDDIMCESDRDERAPHFHPHEYYSFHICYFGTDEQRIYYVERV